MPLDKTDSRWIVALTGASGIRYGLRLIEVMAENGIEVHTVFSDAGLRVLHEEDGIKLSQGTLSTEKLFGRALSTVSFYNPRDIGAEMASGSAHFDGMVISPCSMNTLAAVAHGYSSNLIHRAADVTMKEKRKLVMVPRETPLSAIHLENMLKLSQLGVSMIPAMPGFYHKPESLNQLVDMLVMKILDQIGLEVDLVERWKPAKKPQQAPVVAIGGQSNG